MHWKQEDPFIKITVGMAKYSAGPNLRYFVVSCAVSLHSNNELGNMSRKVNKFTGTTLAFFNMCWWEDRVLQRLVSSIKLNWILIFYFSLYSWGRGSLIVLVLAFWFIFWFFVLFSSQNEMTDLGALYETWIIEILSCGMWSLLICVNNHLKKFWDFF